MTTATPTPTARSHYAAMRRYEDGARSISMRLSVHGFLGAGEVSADEFAEMKARRDSYYLTAAAYRRAARRLERGERLRIRVERAVRLVTRGGIRVGRAAVGR